MPRISTVRPARADQASTAVCRFTCSNGARSRVTTEWCRPSGPRKSRASADTSLSSPAAVEWTQFRNPRNATANSRASRSGACSAMPGPPASVAPPDALPSLSVSRDRSRRRVVPADVEAVALARTVVWRTTQKCASSYHPAGGVGPGIRPVENVEDHVGLGLGIGGTLIGPQPGCLAFRGRVGFPRASAGPQVVAEQQVQPFPVAALLADVHVHVPGLPGRRLEVPVLVVAEAQL